MTVVQNLVQTRERSKTVQNAKLRVNVQEYEIHSLVTNGFEIGPVLDAGLAAQRAIGHLPEKIDIPAT